MSEITPYQAPTPATVPDHHDRAVQRLTDWARAADAAYNVAERLVQTSFVPGGFKGKPVEATAAILSGLEVGISPMASLRAFDVINGQAAPRAITLRAIVQSYGHDIEIVESTTTRCRVRARRRGGDWQTVTWTIDRARDLKLTGKTNWQQQPGAMLVARATSEAARLIAADAILGIGYSAEEVADGGVPQEQAYTETTTAEPTGKRTMSRKGTQPPGAERAAEPTAPDVQDAEVVPDEPPQAPTGEPMTKRTRGRLFALFAAKGVEEDKQLAGINYRVGQSYESRADVSEVDARMVIDYLATLPDVTADEDVAEPPEDGPA